MEDYILRATAADGQVRAFAATTRCTAEASREIHKTTPVASAALGRLLTAGAIMGSMLKSENDLITLQIKGDGPMEGALVTADSHGGVKGYVFNPNVIIPLKAEGKLDVGAAIGEGYLTVIKDIGMKEPYVGKTQLVSGEIADDLTFYFAKSEQLPTSVSLGVLVDVDMTIKEAGGFIVQLMPDASDEIIDCLEKRLLELPYITELLQVGETPETILNLIFGDMDLKIMDRLPVKYHCDCTRERVEKALISLGMDELSQIADEDKKADISCHFCGKTYFFDEAEIRTLMKEARA